MVSKACAELVKHIIKPHFSRLFEADSRAGNVIGGGDKTAVRLVPELIQTIESGNSPIHEVYILALATYWSHFVVICSLILLSR